MAEIKPGGVVTVEVTGLPRNAAAQKTLAQVLRRDPRIVKLQRNQKAKRPSWQQWRRGGMQWHHQMKTQVPVKIVKGASFTIRATVDVLRRLESVKQWVKLNAK